MELHFVNDWQRGEVFDSFSLIDLSYEAVHLDDTQHTISIAFMGLGVWIFWHTNYDIQL